MVIWFLLAIFSLKGDIVAEVDAGIAHILPIQLKNILIIFLKNLFHVNEML
jgi:hypothetical protein